MFLFIDFSGDVKRSGSYFFRIAVFDLDSVDFLVKKRVKVINNFSERFFYSFDRILTSSRIKPSDFKAVFIVRGPGRFSALRTAVSFANAFTYALDIPLVELDRIDEKGRKYWDKVLDIVKNTKLSKKRVYIHPFYGTKPNIDAG